MSEIINSIQVWIIGGILMDSINELMYLFYYYIDYFINNYDFYIIYSKLNFGILIYFLI